MAMIPVLVPSLTRRLGTGLLVAAALAACGGSAAPTETQILATIERCIAKNTGKAPSTQGMPPEMADKFLAAHQNLHREMCTKAVREVCARQPRQCTASF